MQEEKLYLIFEFLSMDLKKFIDTIPKDTMMDPYLVCFFVLLMGKCSKRKV